MEIQSRNYAIENPQIGVPASDTFQATAVTSPLPKSDLLAPNAFLWWLLGGLILLTVVVIWRRWRIRR